jgi:hypothetical protein
MRQDMAYLDLNTLPRALRKALDRHFDNDEINWSQTPIDFLLKMKNELNCQCHDLPIKIRSNGASLENNPRFTSVMVEGELPDNGCEYFRCKECGRLWKETYHDLGFGSMFELDKVLSAAEEKSYRRSKTFKRWTIKIFWALAWSAFLIFELSRCNSR